MIDDIKAVMWKEAKEILSNKQVLFGLLAIVPVFGIIVPWGIGRSLIDDPYLIPVVTILPMLLVINILTDSFAGERERHTLESLLATGLSDRAILFGKILSAVAFGWGATLLIITAGLITVNIMHGQGGLLMFSPYIGLLIILITLLLSMLITTAGVLLSLRASTVRQAETGFIVGIAAVGLLPLVISFLMPDNLKEQILNQLISIGPDNVMVITAIVLLALTVLVLSVAMNRFQRHKLILD